VELGAVEGADKAAKGKAKEDLYQSDRQVWQYTGRDEIDMELERCRIQWDTKLSLA
jgi:hypothetical protein